MLHLRHSARFSVSVSRTRSRVHKTAELATSVYPTPRPSNNKLLNLATPLWEKPVTEPVSVAAAGFVPITKFTASVDGGASFYSGYKTSTAAVDRGQFAWQS